MNYDDYLIDEKLFVSKKRKKPLALRQDEMRVFNLRQQAKQESGRRNRIQRVELSISAQLASVDEPECLGFCFIELHRDVLYGSGVYIYANENSLIYIGATGAGIHRPISHLRSKERKAAITLADRLFFFPMPNWQIAYQVEYCLIVTFHPTVNQQTMSGRDTPEILEEAKGYIHRIKAFVKKRVKLT